MLHLREVISVHPLEAVKIGIKGLLANRLRAGLSVLGIIIGVAAVITTMSIGSGAQKQVISNISNLGSNLISIVAGVSRGIGGRVSKAATNVFTAEMGDELVISCPALKVLAPVQQRQTLLVVPGVNYSASAVGTTPAYTEIVNYAPAQGRFIDDRDIDECARVIVLGSQVADELFADENPIGQQVRLRAGNRGLLVNVVGVMEQKGQVMFSNYDNQVYLPITTMNKRLMQSRYVSSYVASARSAGESAAGVAQARFFLEKILEDEEKFQVMSQDEILDIMSSVTGVLTMMLGGIASIALLVGGIGIMNIMLVSVTERTKEIGIRKAIGARRRDIIVQFLAESLILSCSGGILGLLIGYAGGALVAHFGGWPLVISPLSVILALGFSGFIGLFFGIYPALKAAAVDPVKSLSYE